MDTALIKLLAKTDPNKLIIYLRMEDIRCDVDDCIRHLVTKVDIGILICVCFVCKKVQLIVMPKIIAYLSI